MNKKTALVTGGTGGIGRAVCRTLTSDGWFVIAGYAHSAEKADEMVRNSEASAAVKIDISDTVSIAEAVDLIGGKYGAPELIVNNAGISEIDLFTSIPLSRSDDILNINLRGTMNCTRAFLKEMIRQKNGSVINISSMWGEVGASCEVDYSASKAGIIGFTKALAKETAPSGIRVNCISPGFIMTEMNSHFSDDDLALIKEEIPLGFFGKPEHIADAVAFIASEKAEYITGQVLSVNGGMVI